MAESFSNSLKRAAGIMTSSASCSVGITTNLITGISTVGVAVSDFIDNTHYIAGTKVLNFGTSASQIVADRNSTNDSAATGQTVKLLGPTTCYTSTSGEKAILIGGPFANNTTQEVNVTVSIYDNSTGTESSIAQKIPVPNGSSFVIADTGKVLLESLDEARVYCDTENAIDVNLSILKGVS